MVNGTAVTPRVHWVSDRNIYVCSVLYVTAPPNPPFPGELAVLPTVPYRRPGYAPVRSLRPPGGIPTPSPSRPQRLSARRPEPPGRGGVEEDLVSRHAIRRYRHCQPHAPRHRVTPLGAARTEPSCSSIPASRSRSPTPSCTRSRWRLSRRSGRPSRAHAEPRGYPPRPELTVPSPHASGGPAGYTELDTAAQEPGTVMRSFGIIPASRHWVRETLALRRLEPASRECPRGRSSTPPPWRSHFPLGVRGARLLRLRSGDGDRASPTLPTRTCCPRLRPGPPDRTRCPATGSVSPIWLETHSRSPHDGPAAVMRPDRPSGVRYRVPPIRNAGRSPVPAAPVVAAERSRRPEVLSGRFARSWGL